MNHAPQEAPQRQKWLMRPCAVSNTKFRWSPQPIYKHLPEFHPRPGPPRLSIHLYIFVCGQAVWNFVQGLHIRLWWTTNAAAASQSPPHQPALAHRISATPHGLTGWLPSLLAGANEKITPKMSITTHSRIYQTIKAMNLQEIVYFLIKSGMAVIVWRKSVDRT